MDTNTDTTRREVGRETFELDAPEFPEARRGTMRRVFAGMAVAVMVALAGPAVAEGPGAGSEELNRVSGVDVEQKPDGTYLQLRSSETPSFSVFKLNDPLRLVVDVSNSRLDGEGTLREVGDRVISRVSLLENDQKEGRRVRLIVGFERPAHYDVRTRQKDIVIFVEREGAKAGRSSDSESSGADEEGGERQLAETRDDVERAESEVREVQEKLTNARGRISELRKRLEEAKNADEKRRLRERVGAAEKRASKLEERLESKSENVRELKGKVAELEERLSEERSRAQKRARKLEQLRSKRDEWSERLQKQTDKYERASEAVEQKEKKLEEMRAELEQLKRERDEARGDQRKRLQAKLESRAESLRELEGELQSRREEVESLKSKVRRLERQRDETEQRVAELKREWRERLEESEQRYEQASEKLEARRDEVERAEEKLEEYRSRLSERDQTIDQLEERISSLSDRADRTDKQEEKLAELQSRLQEQRSEVEQLRSSRSDLEERLAELRETKRRAEKSAREQKQKAKRAREKLEVYEERLAKRDRAIERLKSRLATLREENDESGDSERAERVRELEQKLEQRREQLEKLRETRDRQKRQLAEVREAKDEESTENGESEGKASAARAVPLEESSETGSGAEDTNQIRDIRLETEDGTSRIVVELEGPGSYKRLPWRDSRAVMLLKNVDLPQRLEQTIAAGESGAVRFVSSYAESEDSVRMEAELDADAREKIRQEGDQIVWEFAPKVADDPPERAASSRGEQPERPEEGTNRTGAPPNYPRTVTNPAEVDRVPGMSRKRLTIDLRGADIQNVLRLFSKEGGVNIIAGDGVEGTVTLRLDDVPLDDAFLIVLQSVGLGFEKRGDVIRVASQEKLLKEEKARREAQQREQKTRPLEVFLLPVNYAQADELTEQVQRLLSPRGSVSVDERTNTLIIKDLPANIRSIRKLVGELDSQVPQVLIEARIVETNDTFSQEFGIQWGGDFSLSQGGGNPTGLVFPNTLGAAGGAVDGETPTQGTAESPNFAVNLPAATGTGSGGALGLTMGSVSGNVNLNLRLSAAEEAGRAKIVSAPKVLTLDNREATISQGTSIPISVVSAAGVQTVFVDATLELTVTPHVTPDGNVQMEIEATKNEPDFQNTGARGDPTIIRKQAETELLIEDGETTVIGGIYTRNTGESVTGIPVLHKIPILGLLFKSTSQSERRSELLIFITPRVVNRAEALGDQSAGNVFEGGAAGGGSGSESGGSGGTP